MALTSTATQFTASVDRRVLHQIRKHNILADGERIIAAVSGGPDSTALLLILSHLALKLHVDITVAHFTHQLRTETEAAGDLEFVSSLASTLNLQFVHSSADVRTYARDHHLSTEDAARRLRYSFLGEQAHTSGATSIALGHTLNDQGETVLLHLIRGAGLSGVSGMTPRAPWPFGDFPDLARPLLSLHREETQRYCRESGVTPRTDPTNDLLTATRNKVRHEVLPALGRLNLRIEEALARFAESAGSDATYLDQLAGSAFDQLADSSASSISITRTDLSDLPRPIATRVSRLAFAHVHGSHIDLEATHIEALLEALRGPPGSHSLPGGVTATIDQRSLILSKGRPPSPAPIPETPLTVPGHTSAGPWRIDAQLVPPPKTPNTENHNEAYLDADKTGTNLAVRSRRPGDRLRPLGLAGEKKLQDIFVDAKVPARDRDGIPLVCAGEQIAWVVGHCIDERFALDGSSSRALLLIARRLKPKAKQR
jgi:tRNA(Ile)-lysidine synthase